MIDQRGREANRKLNFDHPNYADKSGKKLLTDSYEDNKKMEAAAE